MSTPAVTVRECDAAMIDASNGSPSRAPFGLAAGAKVTILYTGADQDGWDGELICRLADGRHAAFRPEDLAPVTP